MVTNQPNYDDYLYSPYNLNPRENDLFKIVSRTSDSNTISNYNRTDQNFYYNAMESPSFNNKVATRNQAYS